MRALQVSLILAISDMKTQSSKTKTVVNKSAWKNPCLKFQDKICLENILFASKSLNNLSPSIFNTWFSFSSDQDNYETSSTQGNLIKLFYEK